MAKIKLGNRPKSFKQSVSFPMLDGDTGIIACVFKYRTRTEFGAFIDGIFKDANEQPAQDGSFSMEKLMEKTRDSNADYLLAVLDDWDLDVELSRSNLVQLADELPGAIAAIMETYRAATVEGRLKN